MMKRFLLFTLVIGLFAVQASANLWEVDRDTALGMTNSALIPGTTGGNDFGVYDGPDTEITGNASAFPIYGQTEMSGLVGFAATIGSTTVGGTGGLEIYDAYTHLLGDELTGFYDEGITMYVENDNQSHWAYQMFYVIDDVEYNSGDDHVHLLAGQSAWLSIGDPVNLAEIDMLGFRVFGHNMGGGSAPEPSNPDTFHTSVVPVPTAVILGVLGLGVVGLKLRKYA